MTLLRGEPVSSEGKIIGMPRGRFVRPMSSRLH
jgi:hypothetical protein